MKREILDQEAVIHREALDAHLTLAKTAIKKRSNRSLLLLGVQPLKDGGVKIRVAPVKKVNVKHPVDSKDTPTI